MGGACRGVGEFTCIRPVSCLLARLWGCHSSLRMPGDPHGALTRLSLHTITQSNNIARDRQKERRRRVESHRQFNLCQQQFVDPEGDDSSACVYVLNHTAAFQLQRKNEQSETTPHSAWCLTHINLNTETSPLTFLFMFCYLIDEHLGLTQHILLRWENSILDQRAHSQPEVRGQPEIKEIRLRELLTPPVVSLYGA